MASKRSRTPAGVMVHPVSGRWQVKHVRPFVPRSWKKGLSVSMWPAVEKVWAAPVGFTNGSRRLGLLSPKAIHAIAGAARRTVAISQRPTTRVATSDKTRCDSSCPPLLRFSFLSSAVEVEPVVRTRR